MANPVPKTIVSTGCSTPSVVTIERVPILSTPSVTTETCGCISVGYQSLAVRIRRQPGG